MLRIDGKLVDERQDLRQKNREVWVVEATYELKPGISTPEITVLDLEAHISQDERYALPWYLSKRQPEIRGSYTEASEPVEQAYKSSISVPSASMTKKDLYSLWADDSYRIRANAVLENTIGDKISLNATSFLPSIEVSFDNATLVRWSSIIGGSNLIGAINGDTFATITPACLFMKPWQIEQRYFFKTWTAAEWPAYANVTTVTPYWHYTLSLSYDAASFIHTFRNESLKAKKVNEFTHKEELLPMMNVTTTLASVSGKWDPDSTSGVLSGNSYLYSQGEYSYLNTLYNKSTSNIEYGQNATLGTCEGSFITEPVPLSLLGYCSLDKTRQLTDTVGWLIFIPYTFLNFTNIFTGFGFSQDAINRIICF